MNKPTIAAIGILFFAFTARAQGYYEVRDLGVLSGQSSSAALDINNAGTVIGNSGNRAFMYKNCAMTDIGTSIGTEFFARKISEEGQIVGSFRRIDGAKRGFSRSSSGALADVGGAANLEQSATAIGGWGIPVGVQSLVNGVNGNGVYYWGGSAVTLPPFYLDPANPYSYGYVSTVTDVSENWRVLGSLKAFGVDVGVVSAGGFGQFTRIQGIANPNITASIRPRAMNRKGQIVGEAGDGLTRGFLSNNPLMPATDLGSLGDDTQATIANDINYDGSVVGVSHRSLSSGPLAFVYSGATMIDLNTRLLNGAGWLLVEATAINDSGQIVGIGFHNGQARGFLLLPRVSRFLPPSCLVFQPVFPPVFLP